MKKSSRHTRKCTHRKLKKGLLIVTSYRELSAESAAPLTFTELSALCLANWLQLFCLGSLSPLIESFLVSAENCFQSKRSKNPLNTTCSRQTKDQLVENVAGKETDISLKSWQRKKTELKEREYEFARNTQNMYMSLILFLIFMDWIALRR